MAKSARASSRKRNNVALRDRVFGPAQDARTARLSAKLQEIASKPQAKDEKMAEAVDKADALSDEATPAAPVNEGRGSFNPQRRASQLTRHAAMDLDDLDKEDKLRLSKRAITKKRESARIDKKIHRKKPRNNVIFADLRKREKRKAAQKTNKR